MRQEAVTAAETTALRILFVTPRFAPLVGGVETHTAEVAKRLVTRGVEVAVLTADPGGKLAARDLVDGIAVRRVRAWPAGADLYFAPGVSRAIAAGAGHWDLVHCQGYHTLVPPLAMMAARRAKLPYVVTFHSGGHSARWRNAIRRSQRRALRPLLAGAARLIAVSRSEAALFSGELGCPPDRIAVIPNGAYLPAPERAQPIDPARPLILSIGRLERYKGHQRVIDAMPPLLARCPGARLRIVGSGPFEGELRRQVAALALEGRVEIAGVSGGDRAALADLLASASLVTLLSEYEAHPIAVMEALSLARPVLVAYTSGLAELADDGLAAAVPVDAGPPRVAEAMLELLRRPPIAAAVQLPTWEGCVDALISLYNSIAFGARVG